MQIVKDSAAGIALAQSWPGAYRHPTGQVDLETSPQVDLRAVLIRSLVVVLLGYLPAAY